MQPDLQQARELTGGARRVAVLTGAGISAESGVRTFRDPGGWWREYRPEDLATPEAFARNPQLVWEWYQWRRQLIAAAEPNAGHFALVELAQRKPLTLITQNVDGLHARAGSTGVIELHGDIWTVRCVDCGWEERGRRGEFATLPPRCACGGLLRPGVVWFGESLPPDTWVAASRAAGEADLFLVVGTSALVYPAAALVPARSRCAVIEINTAETPLTQAVTVALRGPAGELLPALLRH